jgi:hypothetical protein
MDPTLRVPPTLRIVGVGGVVIIVKGVAGNVELMLRVIVPPPLPVSVVDGQLNSDIIVPGFATSSKVATECEYPKLSNITPPEKDRLPSVLRVTVPDEPYIVNAPKLIFCVVVTSSGLGGGSCAIMRKANSSSINDIIDILDTLHVDFLKHSSFLIICSQ